MARISLITEQETFESVNTTFDPVPEGVYLASIYEVKDGEVKSGDNKGKQMLNVQFRIDDDEIASDGSKVGNRRLFANVPTFKGRNKDGEETLPFALVGLVKALGGSAEDLADLDTDDWLGEKVLVTVKHEEKKTKESGYTESFSPKQYREVVKGFKNPDAAAEASRNSAAVASGVKPGKGGKKTSVFNL